MGCSSQGVVRESGLGDSGSSKEGEKDQGHLLRPPGKDLLRNCVFKSRICKQSHPPGT
jgi:hypothetical protein